MRKLNKEKTDNMKRIIEIRGQLEQAQTLLQTNLFNQEYVHGVKLRSYELMQENEIEEKVLMHKSKINSLKLGNGNNAYFHATVREKNKKTGMHNLEDL